ncbi:MAG TPA: pyridoxal-phosphate dependent enzyme [Kofleriaceae bacterium]
MIDVEYELSRVRIDATNPDVVARYWDLLPLSDRDGRVPTRSGNTPIVHATRLGKKLGVENLFLKDETRNPTGTVKDRQAEVVLSWFREIGIQHFTSSATGNTSTAFATACIANPPFEHSVFIGDRWLNRLNFPDHPRIHVWVLEGATVNEGIAFAKAWNAQHGLQPEGGLYNLGRREGLKLPFFEAVDALETSFDVYLQGISTAIGVYGTYKAASQYLRLGRIDRLPRLVCVQEATCAPMVTAFRDHAETIREQDIIRNPTGIAEAIQKGDPSDSYGYIRDIVLKTRGGFEAVTADEIRTARAEIFEYEGIPACNSSATTVAALKKMLVAGTVQRDERILAMITGSDRARTVYPRRYNKLVRRDGAWELVGEVTQGAEG